MHPADQACKNQALCDEPLRGTLAAAICELQIVANNASTNHDIAIHEERYADAEMQHNREKSIRKALHILRAANDTMVKP